MGKVNKQLKFMCGVCKTFFVDEVAVTNHAKTKHSGLHVSLYQKHSSIDLRGDREPSFADRAIEAQIAMNSGLPTYDAWLLGE